MATRTKGTRSAPDLKALKISPEVGWYLTARGIPFPDCPPRWKTPEPRKVKGAVFSPEAVDRVLAAFGALRHTQGKWAGQPLRPDPWQVAYIIAPVFGWLHPDPDDPRQLVRICRRVFVEVPRKNGKSTLLGGLGLYLAGADGEAGAQVIVAATTKDQALFTFAPIKTLVDKSPALGQHFRTVGLKILHPRSGSYLQAISNVADAQHGANIHGGIVDELHVHKTSEMLEVIETGTGSRVQPLVAIITTADENRVGSVYDARRVKVEQLAKGAIVEPEQYGVVWCAERADDPFAEATWKKSNPGYGISPSKAYMRSTAKSAQNTPSELAKFLRLHLGVRISSQVKWLPLANYDVTGQIIDEREWKGQLVYAGLDLSTTTDFTAYVVRGIDDERGHPVRLLCWLPEERLEVLERQCAVPLRAWVKAGYLRTTEGNVVDYSKVRADILADAVDLGYSIHSVAYDPWNASETVQRLEADGVQMVPCRQVYSNLSAATKQVERLVLGSTVKNPRVRTGGNPLLRWMVDCTDLQTDPNDNVKPAKPDRMKSSKRIDGVVAWVMAEREAMAVEEDHPADQWFASLPTHAS